MAWDDLALTPLRVLINDLTAPYTYSDVVLQQLLFVASTYVSQEIRLTTDYTFDYTNFLVTPDPSEDLIFLNFSILKAACLTNTWQFNQKAMADGISAKCGPSSLTVKADSDIILGLLRDGPCKTYENLLMQENFGSIVKGILSPFVSNNFIPVDEGYR